MELCSLHPLDPAVVERYVRALMTGGEVSVPGVEPIWAQDVLTRARKGYDRARNGNEDGAHAITLGLAQLLGTSQPIFFQQGVSLTAWEARFDRGAGMMMRPPSRLFVDAGLDVTAARAMPIRLDLSRGMMGGAYVPARLIDDFSRLLDTRLERIVRRLVEAELDGIAILGWMIEAAAYARDHRLGLYEAIDVVTPGAPEANPPGARIVVADRARLDRDLRRRLEEAAKPPKQPGLMSRLLRRNRAGAEGTTAGPGGEQWRER